MNDEFCNPISSDKFRDFNFMPSPEKLEKMASFIDSHWQEFSVWDRTDLIQGELRQWAEVIRILRKDSHLADKCRILSLEHKVKELEARWNEDKSFVNYL